MAVNSSRIWLERELNAFAATLAPQAMVLDAGSGDQQYAPIFSRQRYESADFEQVDKPYARSTYTCDLKNIPVGDARYDAIVCTQVMEHVPDPLAVLRELHRVLKPGGVMFWTGPLWYEEHEQPYDFYRYTQFGLRHLFEQSGFAIKELRWMEGYLGTVAHQLGMMKRALPRSPSGYGGGLEGWLALAGFTLLRPLAAILRTAARRADTKVRFTDRGMPINYLAIVCRPASGEPS